MKAILAAATLAAVAGTASADLRLTETWVGISGEDGTEDWIEVTNFGAVTVDTSSFFYDDESEDILDGGQLDSFSLAPGESAIFLVSDDNTPNDDVTYSTAVEEFLSVWGFNPGDIKVGITNGGGGLSQNGDQATLLDSGGGIVNRLPFAGAIGGQLATIEKYFGPSRLSDLADPWTFESNEWFNDNLGDPDNMVSAVGSPGQIPAPGAVALMGLAGAAGLCRRRA